MFGHYTLTDNMENSIFITVGESKNHYDDFANFMSATTDALKADGKSRHDYYVSRNGDKLEEDVLVCMKSKAKDFRFDPDCISKTLPQHFPDIISNNYFGVEVKSTKNNSWQSTGSSIVESLRDENIKKVFMLFGILSKDNVDFRCKPYEQCLYEIAVTHSPRYLINMDLKETDSTIFEKMNVDYDTFRQLGDAQIDKVRDYYRKKYRSKNAKTLPWWIGDSTDTANYELKLLSDLDEDTKDFFMLMCYALFPEVLGTDLDKFRRPALWMCTRHSVICSNIRDQFSAGGTGDIYINDKLKWKDVPKVICNMLPYLQNIKLLYSNTGDFNKDFEDFAVFTSASKANYNDWAIAANACIVDTLGRKAYSITIAELIKYKFTEKKTIDKKHCFFLDTM